MELLSVDVWKGAKYYDKLGVFSWKIFMIQFFVFEAHFSSYFRENFLKIYLRLEIYVSNSTKLEKSLQKKSQQKRATDNRYVWHKRDLT